MTPPSRGTCSSPRQSRFMNIHVKGLRMQAAKPYQKPSRRSGTRRRAVAAPRVLIRPECSLPPPALSRHLPDSAVMPSVRWGLVVPVKRLALAKTRLSSYGDSLRQDLALAFAVDVVTAALGCDAVAQLIVVTDDPRAAAELSATAAQVVPDVPDAGLNPALEHGAALLPAGLGRAALSADLPALRPAELAAALAAMP